MHLSFPQESQLTLANKISQRGFGTEGSYSEDDQFCRRQQSTKKSLFNKRQALPLPVALSWLAGELKSMRAETLQCPEPGYGSTKHGLADLMTSAISFH